MNGNDSKVRLPPASGHTKLELAPTYDIAQLHDDRSQKLLQLLKQGHFSVAPLRDPKLILHSHLPHQLGSGYVLGADVNLLERCYNQETSTLLKIDEGFMRGDKISRSTWRDFLNDKQYTVAYVDFFDEEVARRGGDWEGVVADYLYATPEPLINGLVGGLGHPWIHLAYAYEFRSSSVATEALSLACTEHFELHGLLDHEQELQSSYKTSFLAEIIQRVRVDTRLDGLLTIPGITNFGPLLQEKFPVIMEHWGAFEVVDAVAQLEEFADLSVLLAISGGDMDQSFDFYNLHLMTVVHAIRILWHTIPVERQASILRQYALFAILIYAAQVRPDFGIGEIDVVKTQDRDWSWVVQTTLKHKWVLDNHFFKAVRALKAFSETYGEKEGFYLKAAIKFLIQFRGWEGFGVGVEGYLPPRDGYRPS